MKNILILTPLRRGKDLKELVDLSREGTTVILDEVSISCRWSGCVVFLHDVSFIPGTFTLIVTPTSENLSRRRNMLKMSMR